jgi:hypothetical protein
MAKVNLLSDFKEGFVVCAESFESPWAAFLRRGPSASISADCEKCSEFSPVARHGPGQSDALRFAPWIGL